MKVDWLIFIGCVFQGEDFDISPKITVAEIGEIATFQHFYMLLKSTFS